VVDGRGPDESADDSNAGYLQEVWMEHGKKTSMFRYRQSSGNNTIASDEALFDASGYSRLDVESIKLI
jgi:hypothetical protein